MRIRDRHTSVTFRVSSWYRHSRQVGSHAIDFMQEFFGMSYPEAVSYLLDGEPVSYTHLDVYKRQVLFYRESERRHAQDGMDEEPAKIYSDLLPVWR